MNFWLKTPEFTIFWFNNSTVVATSIDFHGEKSSEIYKTPLNLALCGPLWDMTYSVRPAVGKPCRWARGCREGLISGLIVHSGNIIWENRYRYRPIVPNGILSNIEELYRYWPPMSIFFSTPSKDCLATETRVIRPTSHTNVASYFRALVYHV